MGIQSWAQQCCSPEIARRQAGVGTGVDGQVQHLLKGASDTCTVSIAEWLQALWPVCRPGIHTASLLFSTQAVPWADFPNTAAHLLFLKGCPSPSLPGSVPPCAHEPSSGSPCPTPCLLQLPSDCGPHRPGPLRACSPGPLTCCHLSSICILTPTVILPYEYCA